jgi:hypothetical protein
MTSPLLLIALLMLLMLPLNAASDGATILVDDINHVDVANDIVSAISHDGNNHA